MGSRILDVALTLAAVLGVLGIALFVLIRLGVVHPLVVVSGSMSPTYEVGELVVSRVVPADHLRVGDIASLPAPDRDIVVTHRVVALEPGADGSMVVTMKGDANGGPDAKPYVVTKALVPVVAVPRVGSVFATLIRPSVAIPAVVAVVAMVGIVLLTPGRKPDDDEEGRERAPEELAPRHVRARR